MQPVLLRAFIIVAASTFLFVRPPNVVSSFLHPSFFCHQLLRHISMLVCPRFIGFSKQHSLDRPSWLVSEASSSHPAGRPLMSTVACHSTSKVCHCGHYLEDLLPPPPLPIKNMQKHVKLDLLSRKKTQKTSTPKHPSPSNQKLKRRINTLKNKHTPHSPNKTTTPSLSHSKKKLPQIPPPSPSPPSQNCPHSPRTPPPIKKKKTNPLEKSVWSGGQVRRCRARGERVTGDQALVCQTFASQ